MSDINKAIIRGRSKSSGVAGGVLSRHSTLIGNG